MFLHSGIIGLVLSETLLVVYLVLASALALTIIRKWDPGSASETQLKLEQRTYLVSTIMTFVMGINLIGVFLFVYTVDDLHRLFVGAMCATGTLNANPIGWWALLSKTVLFFLSALWLLLNHIDQKAEDYPLVNTKYTMLLFLTPLYMLDLGLSLWYFKGLDPSVITSCCGSLFSESGTKLTSTLVGLPPYETMVVFFAASFTLFLLFVLNLRFSVSWLRYALGGFGLLYLGLSIVSVISFISVYYYELPTHHCPFDILQKEYHYVGYPLYGSLFITCLCAMGAGLTELFRHRGSLSMVLGSVQRRLLKAGLFSLVVFVGLVLYPMVFSDFSLFGY